VGKLSGYILSVDQATNIAGVALFKDGALVAHTEIRSRSSTDTFAARVQYQLPQLTAFLDKHLPPGVNVEKVVFESVQSKLILAVVGAFMCSPRIQAPLSERGNYIPSSSWKKWAQSRGAKGLFREIKGVKALTETGFNCARHGITSDDVSDAILIFAAWRDRK
jgi:hypothetical protein